MKCIHYLTSRFPCGQCRACRVNLQSEKALRIAHELQYHKDAVFVTLTYDDKFLPDKMSLKKKDAQDFLKRFRKYLDVGEVRYFCCGEYGSDETEEYYLQRYGRKFGRPHYHFIIFGISRTDSRVFKNIRYHGNGKWKCECPAWKLGYVELGDVNEHRINYVAKYCVKKITGKMADEYYQGCQPEFSLSSRKPGLGYRYAVDHAARLKQDDVCYVRGVKRPLPRYYVEKLFSKVDMIMRAHKRDAAIVENLEKERPVFEQYGMKYGQLLKDRNDARVRMLAIKEERKGKTRCQAG